MARMVTRTINGTKAVVRVYNDSLEQMEDTVVVVNGKFDSDEKSQKKFEKAIISSLEDGYTFVKVMEAEEVSTLLGMPESEFIAHATPIEK